MADTKISAMTAASAKGQLLEAKTGQYVELETQFNAILEENTDLRERLSKYEDVSKDNEQSTGFVAWFKSFFRR